MNREFLELYDRELKILYEKTKEFAEEYPGVAERLGGLLQDRMDPAIAGLLEGAAFLAARVQLKLKSEFSSFTTALLDQILPDYLAPIPSATLVQATPPYEDPGLVEGRFYRRGAAMDAVYVERERRVACRFRLRADLELWPLHLEEAAYHPAPAPLQALGLEIAPGIAAGLRLTLRRRATPPGNGSEGEGDAPPLKDVQADRLTFHMIGMMNDAVSLYEQFFAHCRRITFRYLDEHGDPVFIPGRLEMLEQIGFSEEETLFERDDRLFSGFEILRDFFAFPSMFLGFRLKGLRPILSRIMAPAVDILFEFDTAIARLAPIVRTSTFALYAVPASNLFEMTCSRVPIRRNEHEHHIVPDRSRMLDFEVHRIVDVHAHYPGRTEKERVYPLYSLPEGNVSTADALYYTYRRLPRRQTVQERRTGPRSNYTGIETFISLREPAGLDNSERVRELSVRCLVSNRHLTEQLPVGDAGADFFLVDDTSIPLSCIVAPTPPRESLVNLERRHRSETAPSGQILWKLVNLLALNHLGLIDRDPKDPAGGLRELLALFSDMSDIVTERRLRGIVGVSSRPIVRRLQQKTGFNAARGVEVTLRFDEKAFEGAGIFLLGAVLERFLAEYTSFNSFTQTVIESVQRGVVMRWPPRAGTGQLL
jgi:type VI secretion system protein ImpG